MAKAHIAFGSGWYGIISSQSQANMELLDRVGW